VTRVIKLSLFATALATIISLYPFSVSVEGDASGKITAIQSYSGHTGLLVRFDTAHVNRDGCPSSGWYIFPDDSQRAAFVQSGMLAAMHSRKPMGCAIRVLSRLSARVRTR
jgi:hypothetical protein